MSDNKLIFEKSTIPIGNVTPDADGFYLVNAGAYNVFNASGVYYDGDAIDQLYADNSILKRRIDKGVVRAELGHPRREPWMNEKAFDARLLEIREDRYCGHIRKAMLVPNIDSKMIITKIDVCPFGHYSSTLKDALENKFANCYFSVRSFSNQLRVNGILVKRVYQIVTWDFVTEGGILIANKHDTNAGRSDLESLDFNSLNNLVQTDTLSSIDLNDTNEIKYTLKYFDEFKNSNSALSLESDGTFLQLETILRNVLNTNSEDKMFKW